MALDREKGLTIWRWVDAPSAYKSILNPSGDEEWLLLCPPGIDRLYWPLGLESVISGDEDSFLGGFGHVARLELEDGTIIVGFSHA